MPEMKYRLEKLPSEPDPSIPTYNAQQLNAVFESMAEAVVIYDRDGFITRANKPAVDLLGFNPVGMARSEALNHLKFTGLKGEPVPFEELPTSHALRGETVREQMLRLTTSSGNKIIMNASAAPIVIDGQISGAVMIWRDVTGQMQVQEALRESEHRYRSLFENRHTVMLIIDPDGGQILDANPAASDYYGYTRQQFQAMKISDINTLPRTLVQSEMEQARTLGNNVFEFHHRRASGEVREVEVFSGPIVIEGRQLLYSIIHDITARRITEQRLARQMEVNAVLAELSGALLSSVPIERISELVLERARSLTGSPTAYVGFIDPRTGTMIRSSSHSPDEPVMTVADNDIMTGKNSLRRWVLVNRQPLLTNDAANDPRATGVPQGHLPIRRFLSVPALVSDRLVGQISVANAGRDYTPDDVSVIERLAELYALAIERRWAEEALKQERDFTNAVLNTSGGLIVVLEPDGHIIRFNEACQKLTGYTLEEIPGQNLWGGLLVPDEDPGVRDVVGELLANPGPFFHENDWVAKDGRRHRIAWANSTLFGEDGKPRYIIATGIDVTERRRVEADLMRKNAQLEVQQRLMQHREAERLQLARDLHDGPLQGLYGAVFTLKAARPLAENEGIETKLDLTIEMIESGINDLRSLTNDLRPPALAAFGLERAILSHLDSFHEKYPGIQIEKEILPDRQLLPEQVRLMLFRIFQELTNNVARHAHASRMTVRFRLVDDRAEVEVCDNGRGFAVPERWVDLARDNHFGLVGVLERAETIQGKVSFTSKPGEGTCVLVQVPVAQKASAD